MLRSKGRGKLIVHLMSATLQGVDEMVRDVPNAAAGEQACFTRGISAGRFELGKGTLPRISMVDSR